MLLPLLVCAVHAKALLIHDALVFDGARRLEHQDVLVRDGRIAAITPTAPPPADAEVIEAAGRTLLPGFIDSHAHISFSGAPPWALRPPDLAHNAEAHLRAGTTTILDMAGDTKKIAKIAHRIEAGDAAGPRVLFAGSAMTAPDGYPYAYIRRVMRPLLANLFLRGPVKLLADAEDAERNAAEIARAGGRFFKLFVAETPAGIPVLSDALLAAAVEAAHRHGLRPVAHIDTAENALRAARAGVELLVHGVHTDALSPDAARELAQRQVAVVPTLITFERLNQMRLDEARFNPVERASEDPEMLASFTREAALEFGLDEGLMDWLNRMGDNAPDRLVGNMQRMREAGVKVFIGTDANGSVGSFPGAIHEELALFVAAGWSPAEALGAATALPAGWLDAPGLGHIAVGAEADLVLVTGDPTQNIRDSLNIEAVFQGGVRRAP